MKLPGNSEDWGGRETVERSYEQTTDNKLHTYIHTCTYIHVYLCRRHRPRPSTVPFALTQVLEDGGFGRSSLVVLC